MRQLCDAGARVPSWVAAALIALALPGFAIAQSRFKPTDFPPSQAVPDRAVSVGDPVSIGAPINVGGRWDNFLPSEWMDVYLVPHSPAWLEGDPLAATAIAQTRVLSNPDGTLPPTFVWKADRVGVYDIVVDYNGDGVFSYALDGLCSIKVHANKAAVAAASPAVAVGPTGAELTAAPSGRTWRSPGPGHVCTFLLLTGLSLS